jgi:hypothetical protein
MPAVQKLKKEVQMAAIIGYWLSGAIALGIVCCASLSALHCLPRRYAFGNGFFL